MTAFREAFPILTVEDVDRAAEFYCATFGFEKTYAFDEDGRTTYAFLRLEPLGIGLARRAPDAPQSPSGSTPTSTLPPSGCVRPAPRRWHRPPTSRGESGRARSATSTGT